MVKPKTCATSLDPGHDESAIGLGVAGRSPQVWSLCTMRLIQPKPTIPACGNTCVFVFSAALRDRVPYALHFHGTLQTVVSCLSCASQSLGIEFV